VTLYLHLTILGHIVDVPLAESVDTAQHLAEERRVVQVGDDKVEAEDDARARLFLEGQVLGQLSERNGGELGEQFLSLRVRLEVSK